MLVLFVLSLAGVNNSLVGYEEGVNSQWGNVETQYQRRADLIPNLVSTVKGYVSHEEKVLAEVTDARASVGKVKIDISSATSEQIASYMAAQSQLSGALSKLLAVVESYPDLKANENFLVLQAQLEGTENRIGTERHRYNEAVKDYNAARKGFFTNMIVSIAGMDFERSYPYFKADEGSDKAPTVSFE
ncbi:LemA family protein [Candidatus Uhrbacteria bacterium]|nr:LemA family protein [Candidatus Uhrbacteria bacterium]